MEFPDETFVSCKRPVGYEDGSGKLGVTVCEKQKSANLKKTQLAFFTIVLAIASSQLELITTSEKPSDAQDALRTLFEKDSLTNKIQLKKKYLRTEMAEGKSVGNNLNYMKGSMDRWAAIGAPISEEDQVVKVICQVWTYLFTFYSYLLLLYICLLILILCYMSQVYLTISKLQNYPSCHLNCFCYVMPSLCHLEIPLPVIMHLTLCVIFFQTTLLYEVFTV